MDISWQSLRDYSKHKHVRRVAKAALIDVAIIWAAFVVAYLFRELSAPLDLAGGIGTTAFITVALILSLYIFGVYDRIWERTSGHGVVVIVKAVLVHGAVALFICFFLRPRPMPLSVVGLGHFIALAGFVAVRYRSRLISGFEWRWRAVWRQEFPPAQMRVLIVGAGNSGQILALRMQHYFPGHSYQVVGFIDDDPEKQGMFVEGRRVLGTRHEIPALVDKHNVALIVLALHNITGQELRAILNICERTNAVIKSIPDLYGLLNAPNSMMLRDVQPEDLLGRSLVTRHAEVDLSPVTEKDVLISGAAGSIGSELSRQIMDFSPRRVILLDNNESGLHDLTIELRARFPSVTIEPVLVDVSNGAALERAFAQSSPQVIFHAAAYKHVPMLESSPYEALRVNVGGTANMTRLAARFGVERFVFISTDKAVNPSSVMGASKRLGELMLHACRQQGGTTLFTAVRFGNVLGSRGSVVPTFTRQIQNGGPVTITDREMTRYFMTIPEAVNLIIHAACLTCGDDIFLLHMGEVVRIVDLAERMIRLRGLRPYIDIDIVPTGIRPGEKLHEELYTSDEKLKDTIHPGIVQIESWHGQFDRDTFWRHIDSLGNQTGDAPVVLGQLLRVIRFGENGHHVPDMVEAPVPSTSVTSA